MSDSALAISTRCRLATESELTGAVTSSSWISSEARISAARARIARQSMPPQRVARRVAEEDVLGHGQLGEQQQLLEHGGDAGGLRLLRAAEVDLAPVDADRARVRPVDAGDDLDQRRLAGAVLAQQRMDLAGTDVEADVVQRPHAGERLAQALDRQHRRVRTSVFAALACIGPPWSELAAAATGRQCASVPFDAMGAPP